MLPARKLLPSWSQRNQVPLIPPKLPYIRCAGPVFQTPCRRSVANWRRQFAKSQSRSGQNIDITTYLIDWRVVPLTVAMCKGTSSPKGATPDSLRLLTFLTRSVAVAVRVAFTEPNTAAELRTNAATKAPILPNLAHFASTTSAVGAGEVAT
jgi:hypothetical protein